MRAVIFERPMAKADGDLRKALNRKASARDIFLLSGQRKRPEVAQEFESAVRTWPEMEARLCTCGARRRSRPS